MKYCVPYDKSFKYLDEVDEITITYNAKDLTLPAFLEKHSYQIINLKLSSYHTELDIERIKLLYSKYSNIKVICNANDDVILEEIKDAGIPFFFSNLPTDWDSIHNLLKKGPTDIYIVNELGFALDKIRNVCDDYGVRIRAIPHIAQSSDTEHTGYYKFFIRPEDTIYYDEYVDVYDLYQKDNLNVIFKVYAYDRQWFGNLREIIGGLGVDIESRNIGPSYALSRIRCDKKCMKGKKCNICKTYSDLSRKIFEKGYLIRRK